MKLIDTHAHLDDKRFNGDRESIIENFDNDNIDFVINGASSLSASKASFDLSQKYPKVFSTLGCHPHNAKEYDKDFEDFIRENANNEKVVAVGEIGLDYYYDFSPKNVQREVFSRQIVLANQLNLPVVLHIRDAYEDARAIILEHKELLTRAIVFHCYSGSYEYIDNFKNFNLFFGLGGTITYKNTDKTRIIQKIGLQRILTETDCPYLSPQAVRGTRNQPKNIMYVLPVIANALNLSQEEIMQHVKSNTLRAFPKIVF